MDMLLMMLQIFVFNKKIMNFNYAKETTIMKKTQSTRTLGPRASLPPTLLLFLCECVCDFMCCACVCSFVCLCVCIKH